MSEESTNPPIFARNYVFTATLTSLAYEAAAFAAGSTGTDLMNRIIGNNDARMSFEAAK